MKTSQDATYFHSFGVEHITKEINKLKGNKHITINIYRMQAYVSKMCRYFCIEFIDFMVKCKSFLDFANLFSANKYEISDKIIVKYFQ